MKFKLKPGAGNHSENGVVYKSEDGKIIESKHDLSEMFPNKFEKVEIPGTVVQDEKAPEKKAKIKKSEEKEDSEDSAEKEEKVALGKDVTVAFTQAEEEDLKVFFKRGTGYFVTEADEPDYPLHDGPLSKKAKVKPFIKKYLKV